jgi:Fe-S-cluster containining protein
MNALCLARHADYRCRHSGACCTSGWPIPVEAGLVPAIRRALAEGRLRLPATPAAEGIEPLVDSRLPPGAGAALATTPAGACAFYDGDKRRCAIHRDLGHASLPSACRHFPRRCLLERDATFVSLSHYCPTVARMAFAENGARGIVEAPATLVGHVRLEGLDAREVMPPLLRPGMLTDLAGYHAWERAAVDLLESGAEPEAALACVREMTRRAMSWSPQRGRLEDAVDLAAEETRQTQKGAAGSPADETELRARFELARMAVSETLRPAAAPARLGEADRRWVAESWPSFANPIGRFLAAHAFGNWAAYLGSGLVTVVRWLEVSLAVVRVEAARRCAQEARPLDPPILVESFRAADLLLVHLADPGTLAKGLDRCTLDTAQCQTREGLVRRSDPWR